MLKIRDFAKLAEVSMTTLRYYDEIGLLRPAHVDSMTGYRFYTMDQLPHLHRILAFKELGLGLSQISAILGEGVSAEALHGMLRLRQAELQQRVQAEQEQLARIDARLRSLEHGNDLSTYDVVLKAIKPIVGVSLHFSAQDVGHQAHWVDAIDTMLTRYGVKPIDHLIVLHGEIEDGQTPFFIEVVAPLERRDVAPLVARSDGRLTPCELPALPRVATTIHQGHPTLSMPAYQALGTWMEHNDYTIVGPRRKIRLRRGAQLDDALTEIQFPVEKVA